MTPVLRVDSIMKRFGDRHVLKSATLVANRGCVTILLGRNGCGKSTLLRIAAGIVAADSGILRIEENFVAHPRQHRVARLGVFYLPERAYLVPHCTLRQHFEAVARVPGALQVADIVDRFTLGPFMDTRAGMLSGGEARRAEIALAVLRNPRCLLADEPFQGIAPVDAELIAVALRELAAAGCAIIASGHEVRQMLNLADDVVWMTGGSTVHIGNALDARLHTQFQREYLGTSI